MNSKRCDFRIYESCRNCYSVFECCFLKEMDMKAILAEKEELEKELNESREKIGKIKKEQGEEMKKAQRYEQQKVRFSYL